MAQRRGKSLLTDKQKQQLVVIKAPTVMAMVRYVNGLLANERRYWLDQMQTHYDTLE